MAGSLIKIQETTISSSTANVTLTGIDSTFDVYKLVINNLKPSADDAPFMRVTKSGTAQSDANYDDAKKYLKADDSFANLSGTNATKVDIMATLDNASSAGSNGVYYLFNFANSEYSFVTIESSHFQSTVHSVRGFAGGFVHTVASASDGVFISFDNFASGSTIETGTFTLYGLKK
jgi:hypothetical protein